MEHYMLILYVTLNQEEAIRRLFYKQGWKYIKEDSYISVVPDNGLINTDSPQVNNVIGNAEETSFHFDVLCLEGDRNKLFSTDITSSSTEDEKFGNGSTANSFVNVIVKTDNPENGNKRNKSVNGTQNIEYVNGIESNKSVNGTQNDEYVNVQCSNVVNGIQGSCIVEGVPDNSVVIVNHGISTQNDIQDRSILNCVPVISSAYEEQVNHVTDNAQVNENQQSSNACSKFEHKEESSDKTDNEQTSKEQLRHLISRGKLLSIKNKRILNKERKVLHQKKNLKQSGKCNSSISAKKKPVFCSDCKVTFTSQKRYDTHKARNNGQCVFPCGFCDKVFLYRKSRHDLHVRSAHSKERPFKCDVCQKGYVTSDKLKIHKRVHTGERPCVCEECGKAFYSRGDLSTHREYHHISKERQDNVTCDLCNLTFCNQRYLAYHKNVTHSTRRDFHCQACSKSFKSNSSLKRHLKYIHSESKNFKCDACDKSFKTAGSLKKHKVRHVGERSFFCSECNKGFYEKAKLHQHFRTHTGEKPYRCHLCEYKCALSGNLSKHMKTHYRELTNAVS
ncbi:zinc finger protein 578-like [Mercenaria mercenaria]|uniref:zinc finger protein 578-like n=1 Tax=Mercenaria mercenaria TaxID=6596 RepID=UPI00234E74F3|nr:zinc finger protein 578-like [Mercenaria mercenaria]